MNDRYLYRAKRKDNGEWVIGLPGYDIDGNITEIEVYRGHEDCVTYEVDPSTFCQCSGYKGIWENDIFQWDDERYRIVFSEDGLTWRAESIFYHDSIELGEFSDDEIDVIGNVFDNPELLEAK